MTQAQELGRELAALLARIGETDRRLPPVERWEPAHCGEIDLRIARDGSWHHEGSPIARKRLARLFSTVLRRDADGQYYLVTPAEKLRIRVDDAPFVAVALEVVGRGAEQALCFTTNMDDRVIADAAHPVRVEHDARTGEPRPYVRVRGRLNALIARPVFYELVERGETRRVDGVTHLGVRSRGAFFSLGPLDE